MHSARMLRSVGKYNTDCAILSCNVSIRDVGTARVTIVQEHPSDWGGSVPAQGFLTDGDANC